MQAPAGPGQATEDARSRPDIVMGHRGLGCGARTCLWQPGWQVAPPRPPPAPPHKAWHTFLADLPDLRRTPGFTKWQAEESIRTFVISEYWDMQKTVFPKRSTFSSLSQVPSFTGMALRSDLKMSIGSGSFHLLPGSWVGTSRLVPLPGRAQLQVYARTAVLFRPHGHDYGHLDLLG